MAYVTGTGKVKSQQNGDLMVINPLVMEYWLVVWNIWLIFPHIYIYLE
jgi:hypothetical protein